MLPFQDAAPIPAGDWRHIVRFGRNVANYKFALGRALLNLAAQQPRRRAHTDRFFIDERAARYGTTLTDDLLNLANGLQAHALGQIGLEDREERGRLGPSEVARARPEIGGRDPSTEETRSPR